MSDRSTQQKPCTPDCKTRDGESTLVERKPDLQTLGAQLATAVRFLASDMIDAANSGHPGLPLGMADVATELFTNHLRFDAAAPDWFDRDRFVLSAGHGSALLYSLAWLNGVRGVELAHLRRFRQLGSPAAGHPEYGHFPGVETTTGPLGQGLATAVGMAIAETRFRAEFGAEICDHRTYVIVGDGCLMEGISQEAISLAGHLRLNRLIVLWDNNEISIDGPTSLSTCDDQQQRFAASRWATHAINGHDPEQVDTAIEAAKHSDRPTLIACRTVIGKGAPNREGTHAVHGTPLGACERAAMAEALGWTSPPFEFPQEVIDAWRSNGRRGQTARRKWQGDLEALPIQERKSIIARIDGESPEQLARCLVELREKVIADQPTQASRVSSQNVISAIAPTFPALFGGSADLSTSNGTIATTHRAFNSDTRSGNYLHFGIREHAMAAAMNGIALHGGYVAFGGTFLVFCDYSRPAIRLAALMGLPVIHVLTHDSIGVGEDGPTHQPVEHLDALRAVPNLLVIRPADALETLDAWHVALSERSRPTALILSRQALSPLRRSETASVGHQFALIGSSIEKGAYIVNSWVLAPKITLMASGSEVGVAVGAARLLAEQDISARVVSVPCMELFEQQDLQYQESVLGTAPRIGIEAGTGQSWGRYLRPGDHFVGMVGFGASAPAEQLADHFGINATSVRDLALKQVQHKFP